VRRALAATASGIRERAGGAGMKPVAFVLVVAAQALAPVCGAAAIRP